MPLNLEGEATSDLDGLLETTDMSPQPTTLPSVQQLESFVLPSPVAHHADSQSHQAQHPPPTQSVYEPPQAHATTADWVRGQQMQQYPPQHYQGSDPVRHASYNSSHEPNGLAQRPMGRPLSALYTLQPQPQPGPDVRSPKREIKRRTKTGCLTCRRRRIKCDEGQPTCGNCRKSKRECLGYDPIFKTTGLHGPVAGDLLGYSPTMQSNIHQLQHALRQPVHDSQPQSTQHAHQTQGNAVASRPAAHAAHSHNAYDLPLDPSLSGSAPLAASSASQQSPPLEANVPGLRSYRKRQRTTMEDIYAADGVPSSLFSPYPEQTSPPHAQADEAELMPLWRSQYSGMLDSFFETQWYSQAGEYWLQSHQDTFRFFAQSNRSLKARDVDAASLSSLEARLVWLLAVLPRVAWAARKQADAQLADLLHRLDVVEHLLTGSILPPNLIPPAPAAPPKLSSRGPDPAPTPEFVSHSFWHNLGTFAAADDTAPAASVGPHHQTQLTSALQAMRHLLSVLENRDVLYSVAVARHYAGRLERLDLERLPAPPASDPEHPFAKLGVALRFLADEEHAGTTAVVRAVAGLARRGVARARDDD